MPAQDTAKFTSGVIDMCRKGGVNMGVVMMGHEFFSVDIIQAPERAGVGYLTPCPNTGGAVRTIREFAAGTRQAWSTNIIRKSKNEYAMCTMLGVHTDHTAGLPEWIPVQSGTVRCSARLATTTDVPRHHTGMPAGDATACRIDRPHVYFRATICH